MFSVFDHIDALIAADYYEENNQLLLSEAMKLLNRPPIENYNKHVRKYWTLSSSLSSGHRLWESLSCSNHNKWFSYSRALNGSRKRSVTRKRSGKTHISVR